ncbi:L,D-transpeptidase family protein [Croceibacterium xixiisoli]|nr:L,D-transpeptidase family protein [Croceibacterium xixiisoli]
MTKWIGGATLGILALLLVGVMAGKAMRPSEPAPVELASVDAPGAPAGATAEATPSPSPTTDDPFVIKRVLPITGPIKYGEWHWDDEGVPDGPLVMTVDLDARVLSVFRGGYEIGATAVMLGTDNHPTPLGVFPILSKERHNVSEKYGDAPMPWTLRLTWDGIAIHGGSEVERGFASHGCIGTPNEFVSRLFAIAKKGDKVIITRGQTTGVGGSLAS